VFNPTPIPIISTSFLHWKKKAPAAVTLTETYLGVLPLASLMGETVALFHRLRIVTEEFLRFVIRSRVLIFCYENGTLSAPFRFFDLARSP
jgi:hypothetical protein